MKVGSFCPRRHNGQRTRLGGRRNASDRFEVCLKFIVMKAGPRGLHTYWEITLAPPPPTLRREADRSMLQEKNTGRMVR
jgi:hypothetical protein